MSPSTLFGPRCWPVCPMQAPGCWCTCSPALLPFSKGIVDSIADAGFDQGAGSHAMGEQPVACQRKSLLRPALGPGAGRSVPRQRLDVGVFVNQALPPSSREPPSVSQKPDSSLVQIHTQGAGNPFACQRKSCICSVPCSVNNKPSTKAARVVIL